MHVPPLRERGDDVLLLLDHFNHTIGAEFGLEPLRFPAELFDLFLPLSVAGQRARTAQPGAAAAPGLAPSRHRAQPTCRRRSPSNAPDEHTGDGAPDRIPVRLRDAERVAIVRAINEHDGNLTRVAEALGVTRPTLYRKLKLYGIERVFR